MYVLGIYYINICATIKVNKSFSYVYLINFTFDIMGYINN